MDLQNVSSLVIPEGNVRTIHDKNSRLLWGKLSYDTKYKGDSSQQIYAGKNLFDPSAATNNKLLIWTTGNYNDNTGSVVSDYIAVAENTKIQLTYLAAVFFYDSSKNLIGHFGSNQQIVTTSGGAYYNSFTVPSGYSIAYIRLNLRASQGTNPSNLVGLDTMINTGDTLLPYEPYVGGVPSPNPDYPQVINVVTGTQTITLSDDVNSYNYTLSLGSTELAKIGTYQDYIYKSGDDWNIHKEIGKVVLNGSESWRDHNTYNNITGYAWRTAGAAHSDSAILADKYMAVAVSVYSSGSRAYGMIATLESTSTSANTTIFMSAPNSTVTSLAAFKTWLSSNNVTVYYALATPTDTKITDATLIGQLDAIHQFLTRYGYNSNVSGNLPLIIDKTNL